jgi:hypothetical protein
MCCQIESHVDASFLSSSNGPAKPNSQRTYALQELSHARAAEHPEAPMSPETWPHKPSSSSTSQKNTNANESDPRRPGAGRHPPSATEGAGTALVLGSREGPLCRESSGGGRWVTGWATAHPGF